MENAFTSPENIRWEKILLFSLLLLMPIMSAVPQEIKIIPRPQEIFIPSQDFVRIGSGNYIEWDENLENSARYLQEYCLKYYNLVLKTDQNPAGSRENTIYLNHDKRLSPGQYSLSVSDKGVHIKGSQDGVFYGVQSLIQLMPPDGDFSGESIVVPFVEIRDEPRFEYRGMLLDVSRYFFDIEFLKKCVDFAAWHKLNYFHVHLTDDQGWRIEIKKYPELTETGSWRNGTMTGLWPGTGNDSIRHGGYYTRDQLKELVAYAKERHVTIVPEIEMPGHSLSALASYPWLGCTGGPYEVKQSWGGSIDVLCPGKESTFEFLKNVLDEVIEIFPSQYIHIGGDECQKDRWKECPLCQERIRTEGLKDETGLQSYFIKRIEKHLNLRDRIMIGWDEILEGGVAPNAIVMSWRGDGEKGCLEAIRAGNKVILSPSFGFYLDYPQTSFEDSLAADWGGVTPLHKTYNFEPVYKSLRPEDVKWILGGQANVWTEYIRYPSKMEYMTFPRLSAASEVLWSPEGSRDWEDFKDRLDVQYKRYRLWGIRYNPADPDAK